MRILVVGAGALGSFLGARLALGGHRVTLVGRAPSVAAVRAAGGLMLFGTQGEGQVVPGISAAASVAEATAAGSPYELTVLAVKAYDTADAAGELLAARAAGPILTMQNGVGNEETLAGLFDPDAVIAGAIDTPVSVPRPGQVRVHRARYQVGLAAVGDRAPAGSAAGALRDAAFAVQQFPDYRGLKWSKLLMNILANAACAILDWTPAQVMAYPPTARLEASAWQEALAVMAAHKIRPVVLGGYPLPLLAPLARVLPPAWLARGLRGFVSGGRGSKAPSLQLALRAGQPSEVPWLNGAVAHYGRQARALTPVNETLARVLTALAEGQARWEDYRGRPERLVAECRANPLALSRSA